MAALPSLDAIRRHVGNTPLVTAKALGAQLGIPNLVLKDETKNPGGSVADRLALAHVEAAFAAKRTTLVTAAQGPDAASFAYVSRAAGLECVVYVPAASADRWRAAATASGARIESVAGPLADVIEQAQAVAQEHGWYDATPASGDASPRRSAYAVIASELAGQAKLAVAALGVPTMQGALVAGIGSWYTASRSGGAPKILACTTKMGNPIVWSLAAGAHDCEDLEAKHVFPSTVSEPLATHKSFDGTACVKAVRATGGWGYAASDEELQGLAKQLAATEGIDALPASLAGVAGLRFAAKFGRLETDGANVALITARS